MTSEYRHTPVLLAECLEYSNLKPQHTFVDATLGGAGHSFEAAKLIGSGGTLIGIDQDEVALAAARLKLGTLPDDVRPRLELVRGNFGNMDEALLSTEVPGVDAVLFDLGVSSVQIDTPSRGFSFKENGPLDMRMDPGKQTLTAAEIINTYTAADLTRIIRTYSDEKWASRIADFAVRARQNAPIETSEQLVDIIKAAIPASARRAGGHPAKRTFQALRIEVNGELDVLRSGLDAAIRWLNPGGRLVVISYHSLEDRIVKETFAKFANRCTCPPDLPACMCGKQPILDIVTRKPVLPTAEEIERNARARSAKREPYAPHATFTCSRNTERGSDMGAAPAYSYYPERAPERSPRERISVVPGRGTRTQTPTLPSNVVFLAKAAAVVLLVVSLVGFARIGLMSATISTTMQSSQLTSQISDARSSGAALEVSQSTLSNPTKVKQQAGKLGMAAPETTGVITLDKDVVATDESGALSLSKSVAIAAGSEA